MVSGSVNMLIGYPGVIYSDMYIPYSNKADAEELSGGTRMYVMNFLNKHPAVEVTNLTSGSRLESTIFYGFKLTSNLKD